MINTQFGKIDDSGIDKENNKKVCLNILKYYFDKINPNNNFHGDKEFYYFESNILKQLNPDKFYTFCNSLGINHESIEFSSERYFSYKNNEPFYLMRALHEKIQYNFYGNYDSYIDFLSNNLSLDNLYNDFNIIKIQVEKDKLYSEFDDKQTEMLSHYDGIDYSIELDGYEESLEDNGYTADEIKKMVSEYHADLDKPSNDFDSWKKDVYDKKMNEVKEKEKNLQKIKIGSYKEL